MYIFNLICKRDWNQSGLKLIDWSTTVPLDVILLQAGDAEFALLDGLVCWLRGYQVQRV